MIWFTSDTHFFHRNILGHTGREDINIEDMHQRIARDWQSKVQPADTIYHLGDFSFANTEKTLSVLDKLPGNIRLIVGNHDKGLVKKPAFLERFEWVKDYHEMRHKGRKIVLCHYPLASWNQMHRGAWMLHGHCHGNYQPEYGRILDVGIDTRLRSDIRREPVISIDQIETYMETREANNTVDHHREML